MSNMSYCRFQNTVADLEDCLEALRERDGDLSDLSEEEQNAAERLISICGEVHYDYNEWKK